MQRARWVVFSLVVIAAAGFLVLYTFQKKRPDIPADATHITVRGDADRCLSCHGPGGSSPRPPNHPMGRQCEQCHYWQGEPR